jgi:NADH:ubiquinone oxidoreductase subunit E
MKTALDEILGAYEASPESLIAVFQDVQERFRFLSEEHIREVAARLEVPLPQAFGVATFYNAFSLRPKGKYIIKICLGTACHVRGAPRILEEAERLLGISRGETTPDGKFSLETVNCLGACALGPIMVVGEKSHGHVTALTVQDILKETEKS